MGTEKGRTPSEEKAFVDAQIKAIEQELGKANITGKGIYIPQKPDIVNVSSIEEKEPEWLIEGYFPKRQISIMAGDGGVGKTSIICNIISGVSAGKRSIFEQGMPEDFEIIPKKVLFLSSEDSFEYTLVRRLRKNGANLKNIITVPITDPCFQEIKFNSEILYDLVKSHRPSLAVFDPLQSYIPPEIQMGQRNAMRNCLNPLIGLGEEFDMTTIILMHTNKQSGIWGRKRIADSADIWDIARSVLLVGETNEKGIRYISQEKSSNSMLRDTVLFSINDGVVEFRGTTDKKDKDYVLNNDYNTRQKPQREEAKKFILDFLKDGKKEVSELDETAAAMSISERTLSRAKTDLKNEGKIKTWSKGYGENKKFFCSLIPS